MSVFPDPDAVTYAVGATVEVIANRGFGSGFIVHPEGLVVTARHVVEEDRRSLRSVRVRLNAGTVRDVTISGVIFRSHRPLDYALLWLTEGGPYPYLPLGKPKNLRFAQNVLAIGCPSGLSNTVSSGIISNPAQRYRGIECIQTNADIDHGNSGGPLIAADGVVGITVWGLGQVNAARFAVPIDYLTEDLFAAALAGRERCLSAHYCRSCGYTDYTQPTWYCRNCGVRNAKKGA
jgi:serine protease Do